MKPRSHNLAIVMSCFAAATFTALRTVQADNSYFAFAYDILKDSSDPNSGVEFHVVFEVSESDRDADWVGWHVDTLYIVQSHAGGGETIYKTDSATVDTADGLWWIQHAKPDEPDAAEFDVAPMIHGTAPSVSSQYFQCLEYYIVGLNLERYDYATRVKYGFSGCDEESPYKEKDDDDGEIDSDPWIPGLMVRDGAETLKSRCNQIARDLLQLFDFGKSSDATTTSHVAASGE